MGYLSVEFPEGVEAEFQPYYEGAIDFWNAVVVSGAPPKTLKDGLDVSTTQCNTEFIFPPGYVLEGLKIFASTPYIDGEGQILGMAGPCWIPFGTTFPRLGIMMFDSADSAFMVETNTYEHVVVHEMGHIIGLGTMWYALGLLQDPCGIYGGKEDCDPHYIGANGIEGYNLLTPHEGMAEIPTVANTGGRGTANGHWRETTFENELMTGYLNADVNNPLSIMTVKALKDLGYTVDESVAQEYVIPVQDGTRSADAIQLLGDILVFDLDAEVVEGLPGVGGNAETEGYLSSLFVLMVFGFLMLAGLQMFLARDVRKSMERFVEKTTGVANANPMHLNELA